VPDFSSGERERERERDMCSIHDEFRDGRHAYTVEALLSDHLGNSGKWSQPRAGRLREWALVSDNVIKQ